MPFDFLLLFANTRPSPKMLENHFKIFLYLFVCCRHPFIIEEHPILLSHVRALFYTLPLPLLLFLTTLALWILLGSIAVSSSLSTSDDDYRELKGLVSVFVFYRLEFYIDCGQIAFDLFLTFLMGMETRF